MVRNTAHPFMLANVDGVTGPINDLTGVYEGKTSRNDLGGRGRDRGPAQLCRPGLQHYLAVARARRRPLRLPRRRPKAPASPRSSANDQLIEDLIAIEADLWQHVLDGIPPKVEAGDLPMLSSRWTGADATLEVERSQRRSPTSSASATRFDAQISTLTDARDACDALIMSALGDASVTGHITACEVAVTWKPTPAVPVKAFTRKAGRRFLPKSIPPALSLLEASND